MNKNSPAINISPDRVALSCNIPLKRETQKVFNGELEIEDSPSLLAMAYDMDEDKLSAGDTIESNREYDSGSTRLYSFRDQPICLLVRDDRYIIKIIINVPKLAYGFPHNGRCLRTQQQLDKVIALVRKRIRPYVKQFTPFTVSEIELAINISDPVHVLQSFFWGCKLKGSHQPPAIRPGQAVSWNRDRRSDGKRPELGFHLYDKKVELLSKFDPEKFTSLPETVTRLEFALRGSRVEKEFGGTTLDLVTLQAMQEVFWRLFDTHCLDVFTGIQPELTASKPDMLTRMIYQELKFHDQLSDSERTYAWWLRSNVETVRQKALGKGASPAKVDKAVRDATSRANKLYREASARANAMLGRRLSDYVNRNTPFLEVC